jgi:hypothetical protein
VGSLEDGITKDLRLTPRPLMFHCGGLQDVSVDEHGTVTSIIGIGCLENGQLISFVAQRAAPGCWAVFLALGACPSSPVLHDVGVGIANQTLAPTTFVWILSWKKELERSAMPSFGFESSTRPARLAVGLWIRHGRRLGKRVRLLDLLFAFGNATRLWSNGNDSGACHLLCMTARPSHCSRHGTCGTRSMRANLLRSLQRIVNFTPCDACHATLRNDCPV